MTASDPTIDRAALDICDLSDALVRLARPPSPNFTAMVGRARSRARSDVAGGGPRLSAERGISARRPSNAGPDGHRGGERSPASIGGVGGCPVPPGVAALPVRLSMGLCAMSKGDQARLSGLRAPPPLAPRAAVSRGGVQIFQFASGTTVSPGDYLAADRSGCVVVPAARIADVLACAEAIFAKSEEMAAAVERGLPVSKVMGGEYESMLEGGEGNRRRS